MKILTRLLLGILLIAVLVVVAGGVILGVFINPNDYRQQIEQAALKNGGVELKINGPIDWSVFPWLGLAVNDINVRYPDQPQLAALKQAQLSVKLMPLFTGQVEMSSVLVDGLHLNLIATAKGNNWTAPQPHERAAGEQKHQDSERAHPGDLAINIAAVKLNNAQIDYSDKRSGSHIEVSDLNLTSGQILSGRPVVLKLNGKVRQLQNDKLQASADAQLNTTLTPDTKAQRYQLQNLDAKVNLQSAALGNKPLTLELKANVDADLVKQHLSVSQLALSLANLTAKGQVDVSDFAKPTLSGNIAVDSFDLKKLLTDLNQTVPTTADDKVLRNIALSGKIDGPANTLTLNPLKVTLDDTQFNGQFGFNLANQSQTLKLHGNALDADRYLPPPAKSSAQSTADKGASASNGKERWSKEEVIPLAPLRALNLDAVFDLDKLKVSGLNASQIGLSVSAHNGLVKISRIDAKLYSGAMHNSVTLDARKTPLQIHINKKVSGVQVGDLLKDLTGNKPPITGAFSSNAALSASGQSVYAIVNSLNGTADVSAKDGVIEGIGLAQSVCQGFNTVSSLGINTQQVDRSTPFANLGGHFKIVNGVVSNNDLSATLDAMLLKGRGSVDLPKALIDYRLGLTIEETLFKKTCPVNHSLKGVEFPVDCKGGFDTPPAKLCKPDTGVFAQILRNEVKSKVKEKVNKEVEQKLKDKLGGDGAKSLLKGLLGN